MGQQFEFHNPCGGLRWANRSDGLIEVQGQGVIRASGSSRDRLQRTWQNWNSQFRRAGREYSVPLEWLVAIAANETGMLADSPEQQASVVSFDGSVGIMQPLASTAHLLGFDPEDRNDPLQNIRMGAALLARDRERFGPDFPKLAAAYNSGGVTCGQSSVSICQGPNPFGMRACGNYVGNAIRFSNTALLELDLYRPLWLYAVGGAIGVGAVGALALVAAPTVKRSWAEKRPLFASRGRR